MIKLYSYRNVCDGCVSNNIYDINYLCKTDDGYVLNFSSKACRESYIFTNKVFKNDPENNLEVITYTVDNRFYFDIIDLADSDHNNVLSTNDVYVNTVYNKCLIPEFSEIIYDLIHKSLKLMDIPVIDHVWFNDPYTTITFTDGTVAKCKSGSDDIFNEDAGVSICLAKKFLQNTGHEHPRAFIKKLVKSGVNLKDIANKKRDRKKAKKDAPDTIIDATNMSEINIVSDESHSICIPSIES